MIDMLLGSRTIFQDRTGRTPSLDNMRDDPKQRGLLCSDANQAPEVSRMRNRAQDASGHPFETTPGAAARSAAQQRRWGGPGGKKMYVFMTIVTDERPDLYRTPRELAAYEVTQRHLQQPFQPVDLFREMWGDNHAEPAFWSGYASMLTMLEARANTYRVPRESHIKYYTEYNANTGRKIPQHAHICNMSGRPQSMNEEQEELDSDERNDAGPPSSQEKAGFQKQPTIGFDGHDKSHHSRNHQERSDTPIKYRGASAMNICSPNVTRDRLFGHNAQLDTFAGGVNENFLAADRAQTRATQPSRQSYSRIRNYLGVSFNSSNSGYDSNDIRHKFENLPRLPESEQETNSGGATNNFLDDSERPPCFLGSEQQSLKQQQRGAKETIIGDLIQHIPLGHEPGEQQSSRQRRREEETVIDDIIQEIPLAHQLAGKKRQEDPHHVEQHHSLLRSASEGSVVLLGRVNPGCKLSVATTVDYDGNEHFHSIFGELLRTTSKPDHGKHKMTTETRVSELPLHRLYGPTFSPASHSSEYQGSGARDPSFGCNVLNNFQDIPSIPRRSNSHRQAGVLLASGNRTFGPRVRRSPFIQEDYFRAIFSDDEHAAGAASIRMSRSSAAHDSMQTQSNGFHLPSERNKGSYRQPSGRYDDGAVLSQRPAPHPYKYQFDLSTIVALSPQGTAKKYLRSKRSGNRLHSIEDMGTRSPQSPTLARQAREFNNQDPYSGPTPYTRLLQRAVGPRSSSQTPPSTKSMKDAVKAYDPSSTSNKSSLGDIQVGGLPHGEDLAQYKRRQDSKKVRGSPLPFDPQENQSVEDFMIENTPPVVQRTQLVNQKIHSLHSVGSTISTMSEEDALNFLVDDLFPLGEDPFKYEILEVSSSNGANHSRGQNSLLSVNDVPGDETLWPFVDGPTEFDQEQTTQLIRAHSRMTSMRDQTIRATDSFVCTGRPCEDALTNFTEPPGNEVDEEIRRTATAKNRLSTPLNQSPFPGEIERKDSIEVNQIMNKADKRCSEPFVPKTKPVVVKMTRTSLPSRVAFGMLCAKSTSARSEVEHDLPDFAPRAAVKQEKVNEETSQQLEKRKVARRRVMRSCFGFDGADDDRPEYEPESEAGKTIPRKHDYSDSVLVDGRLLWPIGHVEKMSGSDVSPFADIVHTPPSFAATQAREPRALPKQKIDGNSVQAIKDVSEELPATGTETAEVFMKGIRASSKPFAQKLELDSSTFQQSSRRPSSQAKKIAQELLNQYEAKLNSEFQLPPQSSETPRLTPMKSLWKLFNIKDEKRFPVLPAVSQKTWPPQPTVEDEEEPPQCILAEEPLLSKHVIMDVAQPDPSLRTAEEPIIPKEVRENSFAIPYDSVSHQESKAATDDRPTIAKVVRKVSFAPEQAGEKATILRPNPTISATIGYGPVNDQMPVVAKSSKGDAKSTKEWSLVKWSQSTHRKVEESVWVGQDVPLNVVPELYRKTDVAAHGPGYKETRKDRTIGKGDFEGYMAVLPPYLQNPDFPLVAMSPESAEGEKIVPPTSRRGAVRSVPDLLTHVGGTFRHLFDVEPSMTTGPANVPLPGSPNGRSFHWDDDKADGFIKTERFSSYWQDEEVDCFSAFEERFVRLFEEPSDITDPENVSLRGSPGTSSFNWVDEEADDPDVSEELELLDLPPEPEPKMDMKLMRHFSSSWRPFPHKVVEPNLVSIPTHIKFRIYQMLLPFSHEHAVLLSPVATTLKFWPERSFRSPSDIFDKIGAMTLVNRQFHDEIMAFYLSQLRFHITLNCRTSESLAPKMWQWMPLFASQMQYLTVEIDFTKGSGNYKDGCALRLDGVAELEKLFGKVIIPLSKRDSPMRGLTIMARRFEGNRPSGQLVPYKTTTSPYQGNEKIGGKGLGKVKQPDEENWSMINGLAALSDFGEGDDELFYSLQKPKKENRWKNWFNPKSKPAKRTRRIKPTKATDVRDKMGKIATAHRLPQHRRPSGFKVTALRLLTGKSPMPDLNEAIFAKPKRDFAPMSPKPPSEPPRQKWYAHFSASSSRGSLTFPEWEAARTSEIPQMSPSPAQTPSAYQRVFVPTSEVFKDPLPLFDGRRGSAMIGNWSTKVETALGASVAAIEAREKALEAHTEYGYDEEKDGRQKRIARIKKLSYDRAVAKRMKHELLRWFMSKKAARTKRVVMRRTKRPSLRRSSRHGRHRKALRRRHGKINMAHKDKSLEGRTMPKYKYQYKYKYRVFQAMEQLHRGSIPNKVTVFKKKGFFRTRKGKRNVAFLKRRPQASRAGMIMSSPYLPHDAVDNTLKTLVACFGPPRGPGLLFLRLSGFTRERSKEICMQLVCKAMPIELKGGGRNLWPKEAVGTFGKRRAGARFARFEVFEEVNSIPKKRGRIIKIEDKEQEKQPNDGTKELADREQQSDDRTEDLAREEPQPDDEQKLAEVLGPVVDAQAKRAAGFDAQRATMKRKAEVEHKHARQEFEFKAGYGKRKKRKLKEMEAKEAADLTEGTTHVSRFLKKHFKKARSRVGGRRNWQASGMEDDDYDDYRSFR